MAFKPEEMVKLTITGPKTVMKNVISKLHDLKVLHILDHMEEEDIDIGAPLEKANIVSDNLIKLSSIISLLKIKKDEEENNAKISKSEHEITSTVKKIHNDVSKLSAELKVIENNISLTKNRIKELQSFKSLPVQLEAFSEYKSLAYFVGFVKDKDAIQKKISELTDKFDLYASENKKDNLIAVFAEINKKEQILEILKQDNFTEFNISNFAGLKGTAIDSINQFEKESSKLIAQKENINAKLLEIKQKWGSYMISAEGLLKKDLEKAEAPLRFAATNNAFVVKGWVPKNDLENIKAKLNKTAKERIYIYEQEPDNKDKVPVKLKNSFISKPFEFLLDLYTLPNYKEFDPTFFTFLTFPLLFGFMLGDFGYGLVTLALFYFLKKKLPKLSPLLNILIYSSIATIFFGMLFGEFFGSEVLFGHHLPHILSRSHQIILLLWVSLGIGVLHVNWGLIIGFFNEKSHGLMHAINEKLSWIVLQIGAALLALSYMGKIALPVWVGYLILALAIFMLFKGEGVKGLVELPSIFSNILSYARLMALGLASVKLAEVVNEFSFEFFHHGGFSIVYGVLLLVVGHTINIGLGTLGPFLHSLRLHYVEFYTKFFKGGAERFSPFGART